MIKFRVWDNVDYMSTPFTLQDLMTKKIEFTSDAKVMEFVGNGVCEGDILKYISGGVLQYRQVIWVEPEYSFFTKNIHFEDDIMYGLPWLIHNGSVEVIGNIFQHPELVKESKKYLLKNDYNESEKIKAIA